MPTRSGLPETAICGEYNHHSTEAATQYNPIHKQQRTLILLRTATCTTKEPLFILRQHYIFAAPNCPFINRIEIHSDEEAGFRSAVAGLVPNRKKTLLLVDDDRKQLEARKQILEHSGYAVVTAGDARGGMYLFKTATPDAVVLDYEMPTMNGGALAATIRRINQAVPIVMLSGCTSVPASALRAVNAFISKPTAPSVLIRAIEFWTACKKTACRKQEAFV